MSRQYQIPPDIKEKEKIIGGLFTKTQFVFVVAAVICGLGFGYLAFKFTSNAIVFFICLLIGAVPFLPFSFITIRKMGNIELAYFILKKVKYNKSTKNYVNISENYQPIAFKGIDDEKQEGKVSKIWNTFWS